MEPRSIAFALIGALFLSIEIILAKYVINLGVTPLTVTISKAAIAGIVVLIFILSTKHRKHLRFPRKHLLDLLVVGASVAAIGPLLGLIGLQYTTATSLSLLRLSTFVVPMLSFFILHERLPKRFWLLLLMVTIGIWLLSTEGRAEVPNRGDMCLVHRRYQE